MHSEHSPTQGMVGELMELDSDLLVAYLFLIRFPMFSLYIYNGTRQQHASLCFCIQVTNIIVQCFGSTRIAVDVMVICVCVLGKYLNGGRNRGCYFKHEMLLAAILCKFRRTSLGNCGTLEAKHKAKLIRKLTNLSVRMLAGRKKKACYPIVLSRIRTSASTNRATSFSDTLDHPASTAASCSACSNW